MMLSTNTFLTGILLVFFLYLSVRSDRIKRIYCFYFGACGVGLALFGRIFAVGTDITSGFFTAMRVLNVIGVLMGFKGAVGACFWDTLCPPKGAVEAPPESTPQTSTQQDPGQ